MPMPAPTTTKAPSTAKLRVRMRGATCSEEAVVNGLCWTDLPRAEPNRPRKGTRVRAKRGFIVVAEEKAHEAALVREAGKRAVVVPRDVASRPRGGTSGVTDAQLRRAAPEE